MPGPVGVASRIGRLIDRLRTRLPGRPAVDEPLATPPRTVTDARGRSVDLRAVRDGDYAELVSMYVDFDPGMRAQGVPPAGADAVRRWLDDRLLVGPGVVAIVDERIVGHVAFVPDGTGAHELAIFVHQDDQRAGIGTALARTGMGHARDEGVRRVWLTVEPWKRGLQRWYGELGFETTNPYGRVHRMGRYL